LQTGVVVAVTVVVTVVVVAVTVDVDVQVPQRIGQLATISAPYSGSKQLLGTKLLHAAGSAKPLQLRNVVVVSVAVPVEVVGTQLLHSTGHVAWRNVPTNSSEHRESGSSLHTSGSSLPLHTTVVVVAVSVAVAVVVISVAVVVVAVTVAVVSMAVVSVSVTVTVVAVTAGVVVAVEVSVVLVVEVGDVVGVVTSQTSRRTRLVRRTRQGCSESPPPSCNERRRATRARSEWCLCMLA
jgi:hypothetical protein